MKNLTAADLFAAKPEVTRFEVKGQGFIFAKQFNAHDRKAITTFCGKDFDKGMIANIIYGICDEDGKLLFKEKDYSKILAMKETVIAYMFAAVTQVNKMDEITIAKN